MAGPLLPPAPPVPPAPPLPPSAVRVGLSVAEHHERRKDAKPCGVWAILIPVFKYPVRRLCEDIGSTAVRTFAVRALGANLFENGAVLRFQRVGFDSEM